MYKNLTHKILFAAKFQTWKCLCGKKSVRQKVPWRKVLTGKCPHDENSYIEMLQGKTFNGAISYD